MPSPEPQTAYAAAPLPTAKLDDAARLACLRLIRSENIGPVTFRQLINQYGGAQQALDALPELSKRGGRGKTLRICEHDVALRELEQAARCGARPIFTIEPGYPKPLAALATPPPLLYVKGNSALLNGPCIGIVGARLASAAGIKLAQRFALELGQAGLVVVSGLARGIDGAAHQSALETGTIAVLAGGVDNIYPPEHAKLHAEISERGCLVSEMACGFKPRGQDFPRRNRLVSGMALGVLVIEAAKRSGTLTTARLAGEQNREVFAVPGHPLDPRAAGTNMLLKGGATLVTEASDIVDVLKPMAGLQESTFREVAAVEDTLIEPPGPPPALEDDTRTAVLSALGAAPIDIDAIVRATGLPIRTVSAVLMELDVAGRIERHGTQLVSLAQ